MSRSNRSSCTIYVGNLPGDIRMREVEDLFYKYGPIVDIDLKIPPRPPGYAFVEFEDPRDAEDAVDGRDGYKFDGYRLRVEFAHGGRGYSSSVDRYSSYGGGSSRIGASRHSDYRVLVTGLPSSASWQDLKDHMRRAGDVCFSEVYRDHKGVSGIVDYTSYDDMKYAIRKLDDSLFRNAFSRAYIRVMQSVASHAFFILYTLKIKLFIWAFFRFENMIQGEATLGVLVTVPTQGVAVLATTTATAIGAEASPQRENIMGALHQYLRQGCHLQGPAPGHIPLLTLGTISALFQIDFNFLLLFCLNVYLVILNPCSRV
ncbi:hypothetical protein SAY86_016211 [Trapa natans]|uniref:RRM domain-containing protein n=1 Tax=Trapa natans TaxID=22666 RepID=A0AAN7LCP9_TRANT|nr:hypothetical protein SAY86_016211 [Trapa natans]